MDNFPEKCSVNYGILKELWPHLAGVNGGQAEGQAYASGILHSIICSLHICSYNPYIQGISIIDFIKFEINLKRV
jgi:hypothetical protein